MGDTCSIHWEYPSEAFQHRFGNRLCQTGLVCDSMLFVYVCKMHFISRILLPTEISSFIKMLFFLYIL